MKKHISSIGIIGLGLIGTSIGMAIKSRRPSIFIKGFTKTRKSGLIALKKKAIDQRSETLPEVLKNIDLLILATPIETTMHLFSDIAKIVHRPLLITDTASTKRKICNAAQNLPSNISFVGSHPLAGKETSGPGQADGDMFVGKSWVLTPTGAKQTDINTMKRIVKITGAIPHVLSPNDHDIIVASISHLPFIIASLLTKTAAENPTWAIARVLAGSGFADTTRLSGGNPTMHAQILATNHVHVLHGLTRFERNLRRLKKNIASQKWRTIEKQLEQIRHTRRQWQEGHV